MAKLWGAPGSVWSRTGSQWSVESGGEDEPTTRGVLRRALRSAPTVRRGSRVAAGLADPRTIAGLAGWWDARWPAGFDAATPADDTVLTAWQDLSGNGRHLTQSNPALRPKMSIGEGPVTPAVEFINGNVLASTNVTLAQPFTVYADLVATVAGSGDTSVLVWGPTGEPRLNVTAAAGAPYVFTNLSGAFVNGPPGIALGARQIVAGRIVPGASSQLWRDGVGGTPGVLGNTTDGPGLIRMSWRMSGRVGRVLLYLGAHDTATRQRVEAWLMGGAPVRSAAQMKRRTRTGPTMRRRS